MAHLLLLAAAAGTLHAAAAVNYTFAVVPKSTSNPFFQSVKLGCEARASTLTRLAAAGSPIPIESIECLFTGPEEQNATEQSEIIIELIEGGEVDGIAMSVIDVDVASEVIDAAVAADLPIITFDSDAPDSKRASYVGTDNHALGRQMGFMLLQRFAPPSTGGKFAILSSNNPNLVLRVGGIRSALHDTDWTEVEGSPTDFATSSELAVEQMHGLMKKHPDLTAILSAAGRPMRGDDGGWQSFAEQYPNVVLISADSLPEQIELLNNGYADGLVGQLPASMGAKSLDVLFKLSQRQEVDAFVPTHQVLIVRVDEDSPPPGATASSSDGSGAASVALGLGTMAGLLMLTLANSSV